MPVSCFWTFLSRSRFQTILQLSSVKKTLSNGLLTE